MKTMRWLTLGCVLLLPGLAAAEGSRLGRLFFTPEERVAIDQARRLAELRAEADKSGAFSGQELTVNGIAQHQGRTVAVWVNGQTPLGEMKLPSWVRPAKGSGSGNWVEVDLPQEAGTLRVKPGQTADRGQGVIKEAYQMRVTPASTAEEPEAPAPDKTTAPTAGVMPVDVQKLMQDVKKIQQMQEEANRLVSSHK